MSLTKATYSMIDGAPINVFDFGAVGDGVTDDTAAIQAATNAANLSYTLFSNSGLSGRPSATIQDVIFPKGDYVIGSSITMGSYSNYSSTDGARLKISAGVTAFTGTTAVNHKFTGLQSYGGATVVYYENTNAASDSAKLEFDNCDFQKTTDYAIKTVGTGATQLSGNLIIRDNCRFAQCAKVLYNSFDEASVGGWVIIDTVVGSDNPMAANSALFYNKIGYLRFNRMMGVPNVGTDATRKANIRWIDNYGGAIYADRCRFGGESAGMPIIYNFTPQVVSPTWIGCKIVITNSDLFCGNASQTDNGVIVIGSGGYIPQQVEITGCKGPSDGFWFNNKVAGTNLGTYLSGLVAADPNLKFRYTVGPNISVGTVNLSTTAGSATDLDQYITPGMQTQWASPALVNSWANAGGAEPLAGYMKDALGFVHLRGNLTTGVIPATMFTLPAGFRPTGTLNFAPLSTAGGPTATTSWVQITSAGVVTPVAGGANSVALDGITFATF